jgi:hypothetical protein
MRKLLHRDARRVRRSVIGMTLVLLATLGTAAAAQAQATFWVATDGDDVPSGGGSGAPWATISYAIQRVPDGSTILVRPGTYSGRVDLRGRFATGVTVRSEVPYQARLRNHGTVVTCFYGQGITLSGFDVAHDGPGAGALVIQIQDLLGEPGGDDRVSRIVLRDNVLHDSFDNDILKINNGASDVLVAGNVFYNQTGTDEHIDVNSVTDVVIQDNVFFNDFAGSGRMNGNDTSHFIVIKDSNGTDDSNLGAERITVKRNVFLNWEGSDGAYFVVVGEDGNPYDEARDVMIESNLFLGNSSNVQRAPFGVKGASDVTFRNNTISGDLPSFAYAMRLNREGDNLVNANIVVANNVWSDPTGTMGADGRGSGNDFSDTPPADTTSFLLWSNVYWNGGASLPSSGSELVNPDDDAARTVGDPHLRTPSSIVLPRWVPSSGRFADGSARIRRAFRRLVKRYAVPTAAGATIGAADPAYAPARDILRRVRDTTAPDAGAYQR